MLMSGTLPRLLLAGTCLCVYGTPVHLQSYTSDCDGKCGSSATLLSTHTDKEPTQHVTGLVLNVEGGAGPHARPERRASVTQTENGDSLDGRSGPSEAGGEARSQRSRVKKDGSSSEMGDGSRQSASGLSADPHGGKVTVSDPTGGTEQVDSAVRSARSTPDRFSSSFTTPSQLGITSRQVRDQSEEDWSKVPGDSLEDSETSLPSSTEPPNSGLWIQKLTSRSPIPPSVFASPQTYTHLSIWGHNGATMSSLPDPLLPELGPNLMPREDGPESLWTEAARPGDVDTVVPPSEDEATEGTMSSEALPLIFEPFEDVTAEGGAAEAVAAVTAVPGSAQPPAAMATGGMHQVDLDQLVTVETDSDGPSHALPLLMPDWTSSWQASGGELLEPIGSLGPSVSERRGVAEDQTERGDRRQMKMKEDENSEESIEDDSEEDLTETPKTFSTRLPYSLIPPPPLWVQRNQGLMRSWLELIREKAGYVSGMLAPVGIGITGALLIVCALYSIRMIHSFKHQRRKVRQQEQPREPGTSRQDQAMLLADSSEDEF
ncbi:hypothetical protein F7725_019392 [Dissostichus mawsoni]|uniref:Armadillo-like helical domain-containing protein 4 n=1 Tax=Dissostichus mawsoni TaxID=36200 RepID=A0A7J5YKG8_DISMA|nr:hypothetical protein F7725_019392 [Dissostichus mawsoni]